MQPFSAAEEHRQLARMFRRSMRSWALKWREWSVKCPVMSACFLEHAISRRDWALHEEGV